MATHPEWHFVERGLVLAVPVTFGVAALFSPRRVAPQSAIFASALAFVWAVLSVLVGALAVPLAASLPAQGVRLDAVTGTMLLLVCFLGLVIARYSRTYLDGDPGQARSTRWLLVTLGAVTTLVISNSLLVMAVAWTATSLSLHKLLTHYDDRAAALVAAHKKFIISRLGDLCLWSALALIYESVGSFDLDAIFEWIGSRATLPTSMQIAAVLCVGAAALKSAQLPFHGWLVQVMEAPTPVSALLHAGVVNLGGFLMIRLAPWIGRVPAAQLLLVVIGMTTAILAALVMTTRVSVKVALAWSTCAQMGFMLVECGLGVWHLALLHLVAHSLYKAHAFLTAGSAVDVWRVRALTHRDRPASLAGLAVSVAAIIGSAWLGSWLVTVAFGGALSLDLSSRVLGLVVALSVAPIVARAAANGVGAAIMEGLRALGIGMLYAACHVGAGRMFSVPHVGGTSSVCWAIVALGFGGLFLIQSALQVRPNGLLARALHPWLFAGFYLDELFTRLTFRLWPPRLPKSEPSRLSVAESVEA